MAKNFPSISVIIPMFNAEEFIAETLSSLTLQTFQDFEVIVADDCSTDNSRAVVQKFFAAFDDRLRLVKLPKNSGAPGIPRNFALNKARGKYVYFLDADDLLSETALEELHDVAENFEADVVHVEKYIVFRDETAEVQSFQSGAFVTEPTLETFDLCERVTGFIQRRYVWWGCNKLFRRKLLVDNKILFPALKRFEDFVFVLKCLVAAQNYVRVPFVSYYYRERNDSLSHKTYDVAELSQDLTEIFHELDEFMSGNKFFRENPQYKYPLLDFFIGGQLDLISEGFFVKSNLEPADVYNFFREKIFSANPKENVALTSYLFVTANVYRLCLTQQAKEISALKNKLEAIH